MELFRALAVLAEPPGPETVRLAKYLDLGRAPEPTEHARLFLFELYPYASVYLGIQGMVGGEARDRIAGFWRAMGHPPPEEPDHLTVLLACYAQLREFEAREANGDRRAAIHRARAAFLWEHVLSWLPVYLAKLGQIGSPFYRRWAALLEEALAAEARDVGPPRSLPLHLREAPPLPDLARVDPDDLFRAVLTPVWSGIIVTRADLGRAGRQMGIGVRAGERLYALNGMFRQKPQPVLGWLEDEAAGWGERHEAGQPIFGIVARYWSDRARAMARHIGALLLPSGR